MPNGAQTGTPRLKSGAKIRIIREINYKNFNFFELENRLQKRMMLKYVNISIWGTMSDVIALCDSYSGPICEDSDEWQ